MLQHRARQQHRLCAPMIDQVAECLQTLNAVLYHALAFAVAFNLVSYQSAQGELSICGPHELQAAKLGSNSQTGEQQMVAMLHPLTTWISALLVAPAIQRLHALQFATNSS